MKIDKALKVKNNSAEKLKHLYKLTLANKLPHNQFDIRYKLILNNLPQSTPSWVITYLEGMKDFMLITIETELTENCYFIEKTKYSIRKDSEFYYEKHGMDIKTLKENYDKSGLYWINSNKKWY